eukprot:jgi/Hompol1/6904/HPOL_002771-RA
MQVGPKSQSGILFASFNQDYSCISVGTKTGYKIYNSDPFGKCYAKQDGGIGIAEMLFCTSLVALVGAGEQPTFSPRRLQIINTKRQSTICELTFSTAILAIKLNRKRLIVMLEEHIYIYDIGNMKLMHTIDTSPNPNALCSLSPSSENCYFAYPSNASTSSGEVLIFDAINLQAVNIIQAHKSPLSCISFNFDGTMIATASDKGTVIRVFSVPQGQKLFQFRRGTYAARIYSMAFDLGNTFLAVSSDSDTVHIFKLDEKDRAKDGTGVGGKSSAAAGTSSGGNSSSGLNSAAAGLSASVTSSTGVAAGGGASTAGSAANQGSQASAQPTKRTSMIDSFRSPIALAAGAMQSYLLPDMITDIWEPTRHFASAKIPAVSKSIQNMCSISASSGVLHLSVVTADGSFYVYAVDAVNGGECPLTEEHSILDSEDDGIN